MVLNGFGEVDGWEVSLHYSPPTMALLLAGLLDVDHRVLPLSTGGLVSRKHHVGGIECQILELAVWRQVMHPVWTDGGNPCNRSGHHAGLEGVVGQAVVVFFRIIIHCFSSLRVVATMPGNRSQKMSHENRGLALRK